MLGGRSSRPKPALDTTKAPIGEQKASLAILMILSLNRCRGSFICRRLHLLTSAENKLVSSVHVIHLHNKGLALRLSNPQMEEC